MERRFHNGTVVASETKTSGKLAGYAIVWGQKSVTIANGRGSGFQEIIRRGACSESIRNNDILFLYSHEIPNLLGRTSSGSLTLEEDAVGLRSALQLPTVILQLPATCWNS